MKRWTVTAAVSVICALAAGAAGQMDLLSKPADLPELAGPPLGEALVYESVVAMPAFVLVGGLAAFLVMAKKGKPAIGAAVLATDVGLAAFFVWFSIANVTDREAVLAETEALIEAVAAGDATGAGGILADNVRVPFFQSSDGWDKQQVTDWVGSLPTSQYAVAKIEIAELQAERGAVSTLFRSRADVRVFPEARDRPSGFVCLMTWQQFDIDGRAQWRVVTIEPLWVQGFGDLRPGRR